MPNAVFVLAEVTGIPCRRPFQVQKLRSRAAMMTMIDDDGGYFLHSSLLPLAIPVPARYSSVPRP